MKRQEPATIQNVAERAGVSISTVSRSFSRPDLVATNTRKRVLQVAKDLDFSVARSSGALRSRRSYRIAVLLPGSPATWFLSQIIAGLDSVLHRSGYDLSFYRIRNTADQEQFFKDLPTRKNADAVVVPSFNISQVGIDRLSNLGIPIAGINMQNKAGLTLDSFIKDRTTMREIVNYLISLGHRDISYVGFSPSNSLQFSAMERLKGFREACSNAITPVRTSIITLDEHDVVDDVLEPERVITQILQLPHLPTAICCQQDGIAIPLACRLCQKGLSIPDTVSITGFDDSTYAEPFNLTTAHQDPEDMASGIGEKLLRLLNGKTVDTPFEEFPSALVIRTSTARPRQSEPLTP